MAVKLEHSIKRFIGLCTDSKPAPGEFFEDRVLDVADIPAGSSFLETDTGRIWRWNGEKWAYPLAVSAAGTGSGDPLQAAILDELVALHGLVAAQLELFREFVEHVTV